MAKVWKLLHSPFLRYPTAFSENIISLESGFLSFLVFQKSPLVSFQGYWTQWQRFESSHTHHFWDTPQHFLKTHFSLESGFLLFLELQKSLLVGFQGCWTQWQRFESSSIQHFWDTPLHFLKTCFSLESGFLSFLELQKSLLVSFQGYWTQWQRFESSCIHHFWDTPTAFSQNTFFLRKWLSFVPRAPEIPPVSEKRCLEYQNTKLSRRTFFGQWTPSTRAEMPCTPLQKTWQIKLLWLMNPPVPEQRCLKYHYTKLGRWTYFGQWSKVWKL